MERGLHVHPDRLTLSDSARVESVAAVSCVNPGFLMDRHARYKLTGVRRRRQGKAA